MNTPTHLAMTAALRKALGPGRIPLGAALLGSIAPDLPLYGLTFGGLYYFTQFKEWTLEQSARHIFETLYFTDPYWIGLHNVLHSPTSLLLGLAAVGWSYRRSGSGFAKWWLVFLVACLFHSLVDIATHHDDGPLLFWPFNWRIRFHSPISYWDPAHSGGIVSKIDFGLFLTCLVYAVWPRRRVTAEATIDDGENVLGEARDLPQNR